MTYSTGSNTDNKVSDYMIPQWVCDIIFEISKTKEVTLEQATKLIILHGALYYELKKEENRHHHA